MNNRTPDHWVAIQIRQGQPLLTPNVANESQITHCSIISLVHLFGNINNNGEKS